MRTELERIAFVRTQTRILPTPLIPDLPLHTASELSPLWAATQDWLDVQDLQPPFWAFPWAGGQALARFVLDHPGWVRGRRVLDFATGSGLCAIAAARAGARSVLATDIDPVAVTAARLNAELSRVEIAVDSTDVVGDPLDGFDVVLVGDAFYEQAPAARFHAWLTAVAPRLEVLVGDPERAYLPAGLERLASYVVPVPEEVESKTTKATTIWRYPGRTRGGALDDPPVVG